MNKILIRTKKLFSQVSINHLVLSIAFCIFIFYFGFKTIILSCNVIKKQALENINSSYVESTINEHFYNKINFIDIHGLIQKILLKNEVGNFDVVLDQQGFLQYINESQVELSNMPEFAEKVRELQQELIVQKIPLLYVQLPYKILPGYNKLPHGLPENPLNQAADLFVSQLKKIPVPVLDLREQLVTENIPLESVFYKTDHHWTMPMAFWGYQRIIEKINSITDFNLDDHGYYRNKNNFTTDFYKGNMQGSFGRRVGKYYIPADDYSFIYPNFETSFSVWENSGQQKLGDFLSALTIDIPFDRLEDRNTQYLGSNSTMIIENLKLNNGKKLLLVKDSFALGIAPFLALNFKETIMLDLRHKMDGKGLYDMLNEFQPDIVVIMLNPNCLHSTMFDY